MPQQPTEHPFFKSILIHPAIHASPKKKFVQSRSHQNDAVSRAAGRDDRTHLRALAPPSEFQALHEIEARQS